MVVKNSNIHNIMGGMESTGGVRLHNHRRKLKQRFDIIRKLGQGTYGKVQLGINKETGQEVAIKTIKKAKIETEADLIRIRREIQIMSSVQHPNIIHIYEVFENREKMVLVMEYAAGGELYDYLSERKVLPQDEARRIFRQIATAVFYCHKHKICHRDLKLENILLDEHGSAKIADFGLSNVFDEQHLLSTFCGSPLYASPEIVKGTPYHGPEVDCWSLGVLLYTLVYGAMPFDGSNFKRLVKQISQGDYFEPKKPSPASSLIREMLTVSPARRADIEKVCSHWWVNEGYTESCLKIAEELADQTPVRLDLLLSLAPPSSGVGTENIMQQEMTAAPNVPQAAIPTRCHSVGSLMELEHTTAEQQQLPVLGAIGKQHLHGVDGATAVHGGASASHWDVSKRKLEKGASSSEVNLRGAVKRERGKRKSFEGSVDPLSTEIIKGFGDKESLQRTVATRDQHEEKMVVDAISDFSSPRTHPQEYSTSVVSTKDSGLETDVTSRISSEMEEGACQSSTVSSTATIVPVEDSGLIVPSSPDENVPKESLISDQNIGKSKKMLKKRNENANEKRKNGDVEISLSGQYSEKKSSSQLKETPKKYESLKEKHNISDISEEGRNRRVSVPKNSDTENVNGRSIQPVESLAKQVIASSITKEEKVNELPKANVKSLKSTRVLVLENLNSETLPVSSSSEPSTPPAPTIERRRSKIFETADKFNNILSGTADAKVTTREKPKKLFIPGVKVSDFKKAFERKLSSPEISVASFSKKPSSSQKKLDESEKCFDRIQCVTQVNEEVPSNSRIIVTDSSEGFQMPEDSKFKSLKSSDEINSNVPAEEDKKENKFDSEITKPDKKKSKTVISSKSLDSTYKGNDLETFQHALPCDELTEIRGKTEIDKLQEPLACEKSVEDKQGEIEIQDESIVTPKISVKPNERIGKKKLSKVEITLKSATLPRRKTSKAEIKLDPAVPPIEYKTEIEHMVSAPTSVTQPPPPLDDEHSLHNVASHLRSWSLEPESSRLCKMSSRECIIPIQIEREGREASNFSNSPVGRPPAYPFQQRSMSQSQRSSTLSRQSTQESDSELMEPIRKSPREYIIPIAVEGGGYITPRAGSLEPSASDDVKTKPRSLASSTRSNHYRRMSSLLSDTSEDESLNMSPGGFQRHGSLNRREESRPFHFHRLRSSRPLRHSLEHNDSLSSAEEDDDDDDDEGFEILTAESLFSTLLSRVRSLTQRLTVEDGKRQGFPSNHLVNQLTNIGHPSNSFKNFYSQNREPLSRRLSEASSFPHLLNHGGNFGSMYQRSRSRDSSNCDSTKSETSCTIGTFPRGSASSTNLNCHVYDNLRRGSRNSSPCQYTSDLQRGFGWHKNISNDTKCESSYLYPISSIQKSSSGKNECRGPITSHQSPKGQSPSMLSRTLSFRSPTHNNLGNPPIEERISHTFSSSLIGKRSNESLNAFNNFISLTPTTSSRDKIKSSRPLKAASTSNDFKTRHPACNHALPPLPQNLASENKILGVPRPFVNASRVEGKDFSNKQAGTKNFNVTAYQTKPKHSTSLPSIVDVSNVVKYQNNNDSPVSMKKGNNKQYNYSENFQNRTLHPYNKMQGSEKCLFFENETKILENKGDETSKNGQENSLVKKCSGSIRLPSRMLKPGKHSLIPKGTPNPKEYNINISQGKRLDSECGHRIDVTTIQKKKISRFLRPDFFDTPPEESTYVKEREAKKAAEAENKKAKRIARRTFSMRETSIPRTQDQYYRNNNIPQISKGNVNVSNGNKEDLNVTSGGAGLLISNEDKCQGGGIKTTSKFSRSLQCLLNVEIEHPQVAHSKIPGDNLRGTVVPSSSALKSRVEKAISCLQGNNFTTWDRKGIATESTYLKRAVSVGDISKEVFSKSNPKLGRKISSVLSFFSKLDSPNAENQFSENLSYQSVQKLSSTSPTQLQQVKGKQKEKLLLNPISISNNEGNTILKQSVADSKDTNQSKNHNKKDAAKVITETIHRGKEPQRTKLIKSTSIDLHQESLKQSQVQSNLPDDHNRTDTQSNPPADKLVVMSMTVNNEHPIVLSLGKKYSPCANTSDFTQPSLINSPIDETASIDSWCASLDSDGLEYLQTQVEDDDDEKECESVEDRIRRKSFYSRFNDIKKKGRKKSAQFLKDCRASLLSASYQKNNDNQSFLPQASNLDIEGNKIDTYTSKDTCNITEPLHQKPSHSDYEYPIEKNESGEKVVLARKDTSSAKIPSKNTTEVNMTSASKCKLLRPAAFSQNVLKKASEKTNPQFQSEERTSIPKLMQSTFHSTGLECRDGNSINNAQESTS